MNQPSQPSDLWDLDSDYGSEAQLRGLLSTLQLVLDCADTRDWSGIVGDVAKFALGSISIVFDLLFMVQHYVLYPPKRAGTAHAPLLGVQ